MDNSHSSVSGNSRLDCDNTSSGNSGEGNADGGETGEAQDEESASHSNSFITIEKELDNFRMQWQRELDSSPCRSRASPSSPAEESTKTDAEENNEKGIEEKARCCFLQGVYAEQKGKLYEAIAFYRRAVQLVPDIEFRIYDSTYRIATDNYMYGCKEPSSERKVESHIEDNNVEVDDLIEKFQKLSAKTGNSSICMPLHDQKTTHISVLPTEVFIYILKWIVSCELDVFALEQVARVCRGFYLCARAPDIWKLACLKIWGVSSGSPNKYGTWREMFLQRPHLSFNGAYISKTTYVRYGEPSFQDTNYRPCYLVEYFRYLRFFPEGLVLMITTPDDPYQSLVKLRNRKPKHPDVLCGHYRLHGNKVTAIIQRPKAEIIGSLGYYRYRKRQMAVQETPEQTFHLELEVRTVKGRPNYQLLWNHYSIHIVHRNGQETISEFDITPANFPPFWFSRVRSFSSESDSPLQ